MQERDRCRAVVGVVTNWVLVGGGRIQLQPPSHPVPAPLNVTRWTVCTYGNSILFLASKYAYFYAFDFWRKVPLGFRFARMPCRSYRLHSLLVCVSHIVFLCLTTRTNLSCSLISKQNKHNGGPITSVRLPVTWSRGRTPWQLATNHELAFRSPDHAFSRRRPITSASDTGSALPRVRLLSIYSYPYKVILLSLI